MLSAHLLIALILSLLLGRKVSKCIRKLTHFEIGMNCCCYGLESRCSLCKTCNAYCLAVQNFNMRGTWRQKELNILCFFFIVMPSEFQ